jgi:hypothetical protein
VSSVLAGLGANSSNRFTSQKIRTTLINVYYTYLFRLRLLLFRSFDRFSSISEVIRLRSESIARSSYSNPYFSRGVVELAIVRFAFAYGVILCLTFTFRYCVRVSICGEDYRARGVFTFVIVSISPSFDYTKFYTKS